MHKPKKILKFFITKQISKTYNFVYNKVYLIKATSETSLGFKVII